MGVEIERKFLVDKKRWESVKPSAYTKIRQGYIYKSEEKTIRVRVKGNKGYLTIKGKTQRISREEFEYIIPKEEAQEILELFCDKEIVKNRYIFNFKGYMWEVDEFITPKNGLILAEIELPNESSDFDKPEWVLKDVSRLPEYYNVNMV